jgi:hypothetical protein
VAGLWCRAVRLESGAWGLTLWAQDNKDVRAHVLNDFRGAV